MKGITPVTLLGGPHDGTMERVQDSRTTIFVDDYASDGRRRCQYDRTGRTVFRFVEVVFVPRVALEVPEDEPDVCPHCGRAP